jgi:hypothetical protein
VAVRWRPGFSPAAGRLRIALPRLAAAAFAVASRSASGLVTAPLPSTVSTGLVASVHGSGTDAS